MEPLTIHLKTLTPIWTGGVDDQRAQSSERLQETGIIGSIRWWYEAVVRGLGGYACDPTSDNRCLGKDDHRCPACELFGCTGWSRKFRIRILDKANKLIQYPLDKPNQQFIIDLLELRPIKPVEKWILRKTVKVICKYGAIGGRITRKPQKKKGEISKDYGLIQLIKFPDIPDVTVQDVERYLRLDQFILNSVINYVFTPPEFGHH